MSFVGRCRSVSQKHPSSPSSNTAGGASLSSPSSSSVSAVEAADSSRFCRLRRASASFSGDSPPAAAKAVSCCAAGTKPPSWSHALPPSSPTSSLPSSNPSPGRRTFLPHVCARCLPRHAAQLDEERFFEWRWPLLRWCFREPPASEARTRCARTESSTCMCSSLADASLPLKAAMKVAQVMSCWREKTLDFTPPPRGRACVARFFWWNTRPYIGQPKTLHIPQGWPVYLPSVGMRAVNSSHVSPFVLVIGGKTLLMRP
mmetsp:Transcript_19095/g.62375  ORF Transcript_19095/g.62375 Transcript_19095/m.62375 type:complete len:259 (-) Transcript_19095:308-1084(-)